MNYLMRVACQLAQDNQKAYIYNSRFTSYIYMYRSGFYLMLGRALNAYAASIRCVCPGEMKESS